MTKGAAGTDTGDSSLGTQTTLNAAAPGVPATGSFGVPHGGDAPNNKQETNLSDLATSLRETSRGLNELANQVSDGRMTCLVTSTNEGVVRTLRQQAHIADAVADRLQRDPAFEVHGDEWSCVAGGMRTAVQSLEAEAEAEERLVVSRHAGTSPPKEEGDDKLANVRRIRKSADLLREMAALLPESAGRWD